MAWKNFLSLWLAAVLGFLSGLVVIFVPLGYFSGLAFGVFAAAYIYLKGERQRSNFFFIILFSGFSFLMAFLATVLTLVDILLLQSLVGGAVGAFFLSLGMPSHTKRRKPSNPGYFIFIGALLVMAWFMIINPQLDVWSGGSDDLLSLHLIYQTGMMITIAYFYKKVSRRTTSA